MSWLDSALDEMGLGPRWVRRESVLAQPAAGADGTVPADDAARTAAASVPRIARTAEGVGQLSRAMPGVGAASSATAAPDAVPPRGGASDAALPCSGLADTAPARGGPADAETRAAVASAGPAAASTTAADGRGPAADVGRPDASANVPTVDEERAARPTAPPETAALTDADGNAMPPAHDAALDDPSWFDLVPVSDAGHAFAPAAPAAARSPVAGLGWDELAARVAECQRCRLCEKRTRTVFGVGDREADWMLIGEAPGENEDRQGEPFVGQAGKLLDSMLHALSLKRGENVYIANVIKCRPPGNRNPEPDEVARCEPYLQRQVELVKPTLIVAMGRFAAQTLLKSTGSIASMRGRIHQYEGVPVVVSYHPAYLLRRLPDKAKAWADLCLARDAFRKARHAASDA